MLRSRTNLKNKLLFFLMFLGILIFAVFFIINYLKSPIDNNAQIEGFVVQKGEGINSVGDKLEKMGFIRSALVFKLLAKNSTSSASVEAGTFKISKSMTLDEILKKLTTEKSSDQWVTLIEGLRVEEMAIELSDELGVSAEEFIGLSKEGYMFPDTYLFNKEATIKDIISRIKDNFETKYTTELKSKIRKQGLTDEEGVILASLVEREGRSEKVREEVAGIMLKRLNLGMKLDIDATVQYAKDTQSYKANGGKLDKFWKPIIRADYLSVISPFNTYLNNGLPPAPICNPSLISLKAVANANPNTPYLYYYHDSEGNSHYAKTIEEHNENVSTYP